MHDPVASSTLFIALVGGLYAIYTLRSIPATRRARIFADLDRHYAATLDSRREVLAGLPPLVLIAQHRLRECVDDINRVTAAAQASATPEQQASLDAGNRNVFMVKRELEHWSSRKLGISFTSADELLRSEAKLRAMMWAIETIQIWRAGSSTEFVDKTESEIKVLLGAASKAVNGLNDFAASYVNGVYPSRFLFGKLHRSIAPTSTALQPFIWARSINGRWGRRIIHLGLSAEHYNDVTAIHRATAITWVHAHEAEPRQLVTHPARTVNIYGHEVIDEDMLKRASFLPYLRLWWQARFWTLAVSIGVRKYGGRRLKRHKRHENEFAAILRYLGLDQVAKDSQRRSTDFSWSLRMTREQMRAVKNNRTARQGGLLRWFYLKPETSTE